MNISEKLVEQAYKKLKSSVYFDKTQLVLRNRLVELEMNKGSKMDKYLEDTIYSALKDRSLFDKLQSEILAKISVNAFPKEMHTNSDDIIMNSAPKELKIEKLQYFIDMPIEGHILGVLWIMLMGYKIDEKIYEHSYGNRIRRNLISELSNNPTYSPYLFEPYFEQYESWRDKALSAAQKHLSSEQDVVILTLDFKRYYYSLDVDSKVMSALLDEVDFGADEEELMACCKMLNEFIEKVINTYSGELGDEFEGRNVLPIGFLPSNIIGNWCLKRFDKAVVDGWNPIYYGRYVDDLIIVDKIERNSDLYEKTEKSNLHRDDLIGFFLTSCSRWNGLYPVSYPNMEHYSVLTVNEKLTEAEKEKSNNEDIVVYSVNKIYNPTGEENRSEITIQNSKVKIFYFKHEESDALIDCFKKNIAQSKSEFRFLPEDEVVFQKDDYSDIYSLTNSDTVNKFRGVEKVSIDKYSLSKFLGKYLRISSLIHDKSESGFEKDILKIFNTQTILENYSAWEKIIEILVINERFDAVEKLCHKIVGAIDRISFVAELPPQHIDMVKSSLYKQLYSGICRNYALVWNEERSSSQKKLYSDLFRDKDFDHFDEMIEGYRKTKMIDKSVLPLPIEMLREETFCAGKSVNLTRLGDVIHETIDEWKDNDYKYYPYLVNLYDWGIISCIEQMKRYREKIPFEKMDDILKLERKRYLGTNYRLEQDDERTRLFHEVIRIGKFVRKEDKEKNKDKEDKDINYVVSVGKGKKEKLKVAIANVKLNPTNFERIVKDNPNRSYYRYKDLAEIINSAIKGSVDMLVMPESYVPFEWLTVLARTCAKNQIAIITGVEHVKMKRSINGGDENAVFNLTAIILPYMNENHKSAHIQFHLKKHYAPSEEDRIKGYNMSPIKGNHHELYKWNDCYFAVYCCYELSSIFDRALFQSYADAIVAVEWNRDVMYYSNVLESLSRDVHCYCIQVNSSDYGDSRITRPSKTEEKDMIRTKGGSNSSILIDEICISDLRDFQLKEYSLQQSDKRYKNTPPNFDKDIVLKKIKGEDLSDYE